MAKAAQLETRRQAPKLEIRGAEDDPLADAPLAGDRPGPSEYEQPEGLILNNATPDAEVGNGAGGGELTSGTEYESGFSGSESVSFRDDLVLPDAILGSYPGLDDGLRAEVIIGTDDRIRIQATTTFPWRAICALKITAADGRLFIGTGWLIGPRTVMTAGHCVFMHDAGGWVRSIDVIAGCNDASRPYGTARGTAFRSVTGWTQSKNRNNDYGCIILPSQERLGDKTGYFGFAVRDNNFLMSAALNLSGYPGDKGGNQQWFMAQKAKSVSSRVITYEIDTMGGQSGSPVWVLQNGVRTAVGVHTNGASSGNSATRIESNVFERMKGWKELGM